MPSDSEMLEMDARIHVEVMGLNPSRQVRARGSDKMVTVWGGHADDGQYDERVLLAQFGAPPAYTRDIAAAWDVASAVTTKGRRFELSMNCDGCYAKVSGFDYEFTSGDRPLTAPLAICKAALACIKEKNDV